MKEPNNVKQDVNKYLIDGCMRCKLGGTPKCKVLNWVRELELLRKIALETGLAEEIKWGVPVYTHKGKNVVTLNALKDSANIGFFKGVLLTDKHKILEQQGNMQSVRIIRFKNIRNIENLNNVLKDYITEAINIEDRGEKVLLKKDPVTVPAELTTFFKQDPGFKNAFYSLSAGRQRGYIFYFSKPKQSKTRIVRIERSKMKIFKGFGLNEN